MAFFTEQQRASLVAWRNALALINQRASEARVIVDTALLADENPSLNGNVTAEAVHADLGDRWNDARNKCVDAAEALPLYEAE